MAKRDQNRKNNSEQSVKRKAGKRLFPKYSVDEALIIAQKLKELNGGNPWGSDDVARACGMSKATTNFYYLTAASRDYGLTLGTRDSARIELTPLGRELVYAPNPASEYPSKMKAFLNVEVFKKVLEYYKGGVLPEMKYLGNTLENEFGLNPSTHEEFSILFKANCSQLSIKAGPVNNLNGGSDNAPSTVVIGEPRGKAGPKLFVIMPFVEKLSEHHVGFFNEVLSSLITPAAVRAGFQVETANRQGSDVIHSTIINDLLEADLVLADLTEHNPNVLFELGVRMAKNKPIVLIKATGTGRIFDIDNMLRVYEYDSNLWKTTVETDLPKLKEHIESAWRNRDNGQTYMNILLKGAVTPIENNTNFLSKNNEHVAKPTVGLQGNA